MIVELDGFPREWSNSFALGDLQDLIALYLAQPVPAKEMLAKKSERVRHEAALANDAADFQFRLEGLCKSTGLLRT